MNLVILQDYLRNGGTERQSLFLAEYFQGLGWEVRLLVFRPGGRLAGEVARRNLAMTVLQSRDTGLPLYAPRLGATLRGMNPDLVLCMGRTANCYAGFLQRRYPELRIIGTVRTGKRLLPMQTWAMRRVRAVMVNSSWWKRRLLKRGYDPENIHVVRNALLLHVDAEQQLAARKHLREQRGVSEETCLFLSVATFRPGKRHLDLIRYFAELRGDGEEIPWQLWLVGEGQHLVRCKKLARSLGMEDRVVFWGYQHDPLPFYGAADVAVSASREDSLPNFLIEAQAAGLPTIAYHFRGVRECCRPGESGLIIPEGDSVAFVAALRRLLRDSVLRRRMGEQGPVLARERFSQEPQAERMRRFLQRIARR